MGQIASKVLAQVNSMRGLRGEMDSSKSIGRRYARMDEIGVPWAITVDHRTVEDGSVTVRRRDDQKQIRATVDDVLSNLASGTVESLF
jgi:glycyl-tRNA synthetase